MKTKIVVVQGSMEECSATASLVGFLGRVMTELDAEVDYLDLRELELPLFETRRAKTVPAYLSIVSTISAADGFILGTPDYHGNPSGALKNFLDYFWREFTGKLFGYVCCSHDKGVSAMDALRVVVRQCYGWSMPYGVCAASGVDIEREVIRSDALRKRLEMMGFDVVRYARLLSLQRATDLAGSYPTFLSTLRI